MGASGNTTPEAQWEAMQVTDMRERILRGMLAGLAGTAAMTAMMRLVGPRVMPKGMLPEQFFPEQIVECLEARMGQPEALGERQTKAAALVLHFGYGSAMGAAYSALAERLQGIPQPLRGVAYGVMIWAVGFEGWGPASGLLDRTTSKPPKKWVAPIMAHVIYGLATTNAYRMLKEMAPVPTPALETEERMEVVEEAPVSEERPVAVSGE